MQNLISVIIPIYNTSEVLERCLESIINQTHQNLEIILVNDGSTDGSQLICDKYEKKYKRIKTILKKNGGAASARNKGLDIAKGKYISFVDSDDWVEKDFIEILHKILTQNNGDISQVQLISENEKTSLYSTREEKIEKISGREAIKNLYKRDSYINTVSPCTKLYKNEIFKTLRFPEGMIYEDEAIIHEILYCSNYVVINKSVLYHYMTRDNSVMQKKFRIKNLDSIKAFERRLDFFDKNNEKELVLLTLPIYFRSLLGNLTKLNYSNIENKDEYIDEIRYKLLFNMNNFKSIKNMNIIDSILLSCCIINLDLGIIVNNHINKLKKRVNR